MKVGQYVFGAYLDKNNDIKIKKSTIVKITDKMVFIYPTMRGKGKFRKEFQMSFTRKQAFDRLLVELQKKESELTGILENISILITRAEMFSTMSDNIVEFNEKWGKKNEN